MFDAPAIGSFLHDAAFEISPQRLWRCFLGKKHILQTSWIQSGFQDVDFVGVGGPGLRYVRPVCLRILFCLYDLNDVPLVLMLSRKWGVMVCCW